LAAPVLAQPPRKRRHGRAVEGVEQVEQRPVGGDQLRGVALEDVKPWIAREAAPCPHRDDRVELDSNDPSVRIGTTPPAQHSAGAATDIHQDVITSYSALEDLLQHEMVRVCSMPRFRRRVSPQELAGCEMPRTKVGKQVSERPHREQAGSEQPHLARRRRPAQVITMRESIGWLPCSEPGPVDDLGG